MPYKKLLGALMLGAFIVQAGLLGAPRDAKAYSLSIVAYAITIQDSSYRRARPGSRGYPVYPLQKSGSLTYSIAGDSSLWI
jgi:hypothetical protein